MKSLFDLLVNLMKITYRSTLIIDMEVQVDRTVTFCSQSCSKFRLVFDNRTKNGTGMIRFIVSSSIEFSRRKSEAGIWNRYWNGAAATR